MAKSLKSIKAVFLDIDDTLFHSEAAYAYALQSIGFDPVGEKYQAARSAVKKRLPKGHVAARNRTLYFKTLLDQSGEFSVQKTLSLTAAYEEALLSHIKTQWKQLNRNALLTSLKKNFKLILLSNENLRTQLIKLSSCAEGCFDALLVSEEVGVEKPDEKIFKIALQNAEVEAHQVLMVGNDWICDIEPALKLGMAACLTTEFSIKDTAESGLALKSGAHVVEKLSELTALLGVGR